MLSGLMQEEKNSYLLKTIQEYGKGLLSFIRGKVRSDEDAQDILQDIWYSLSSVVNTSPVEQTAAWLYTVARNKITDKYRKQRESLLDDVFSEDDNQEQDYNSILFPDESTPETELLRNLFWEALFSALDELPPEQKEVFVWQELEDVPFQEIAERTGVKVQTLVTRKRYAVLHLRKRLRQLYEELTD